MAIARSGLRRANLIAATHSIFAILRPKIVAARRGLLAAALVIVAGISHGGAAVAQTVPAPGILAPGNAAVTGFSGASPPRTIAPGTDPEDKTFIDLAGPAFRIIDLQNMGGPPAAQLVNARKPYTATAAQIGQVFAVALDNAMPPNIYVAATSAYGLPIVIGANRAKRGARGATFMPGLFGPRAQNGGPGSIWKIDGKTGAVTRFANITLNGADNPGPALGGLAFDPGSNTLLAADRSTGMIHRFDLSGTERGIYDHGIQGRLAALLPPVPYDPSKRLDITKPSFDSGNPATWGYAAPERLIFGLAVQRGRLYYTVAVDMQVWSVGIAPNGAFGTDARVEITVPPGESPSEISKITFDDQGRMLLAERPIPTGDYGFHALSQEGIGRVLRYARQPDGSWQQVPDEYAIGFPLHLRNGNGGVAIGYAYGASGAIDRASCGGYVWSSGEQLRVSHDPAVAAQLAQGGAPIVNGLQGNAIDLVRPANVPPLRSYYVDFDDKLDDADTRGHMGDIAIYRVCGLGQLPSGLGLPPGLALPPGLTLPPGGVLPPLPPPPPTACLPGTTPQPGYQCCPDGTYMDASGQCASVCPPGVAPSPGQNGFLCALGFDPTTYDPNALLKLRCIGGATPDWNAVLNDPNKYVYLCLSHSLYYNPPICPAGWTKTTVGQAAPDGFLPGPTGIPAIDNQQVCGRTAQQQSCTGNQQIGADGQCHQLCPSHSGSQAYPIPSPLIAQCCAIGSVVSPTGQCCPPGSTIDPTTGECLPPPCVPGTPGCPMPCPPGTPNCPDCPPGTVQEPGFSCCPMFSSLNASGQCVPWCPPGVNPNQSTKGTPNIALCGAGIDPTTYDPAHPGFLRCADGSTPALVNSPQLSDQTMMLACLDRSPINPPVCPAGSTKTTVGQTPNHTGIPEIDNEQICARTPQQLNCPSGQQIGLDGQCHQICPGGIAYPSQGQCCAAGSVLTPTGQCCPAGSIVDPITGQCTPPPTTCPAVDCAPGQTFNPATCTCEPPPGGCTPRRACPPNQIYNPETCECEPHTPPEGCPQLDCVAGQTFNPATCMCEPHTPPGRCPPELQDNDHECCLPPKVINPYTRACCPAGSTPTPTGCTPPPGRCVQTVACKEGDTFNALTCMCEPHPTPTCPANQHWNGRQCLCDSNNLPAAAVTGQCPPRIPIPFCPVDQHWNGRQCVCNDTGALPTGGRCPASRPTPTPTPTPTPVPPVTTCPANQHWNGRQCLCNDTNVPPTGGQCPTRPTTTPCAAGMIRSASGVCVCPGGKVLVDGRCVGPPTPTTQCRPPYVLEGGNCVKPSVVPTIPPKVTPLPVPPKVTPPPKEPPPRVRPKVTPLPVPPKVTPLAVPPKKEKR